MNTPFLLVLSLILTSPTFATTFNVQPFTETLQEAPIVVRGKITSRSGKGDWGADSEGNKRIYTYYELTPSEVLKGNAPKTPFQIREMGGEKDGTGLTIPGTVQFSQGEDVVLLLRNKNSDESFDIDGMSMGKYNIEQDSEGREYLVGLGVHDEHKKWFIENLRETLHHEPSSQSHTLAHTLTHPQELPHSSPHPEGNILTPQNSAQPHEEMSEDPPLEKHQFGSVAKLIGIFVLGIIIGIRIARPKKKKR